MEDSPDKKFSLVLLIPKNMDAANKAKFLAMYNAANAACQEKFGKPMSAFPPGTFKNPFRDGAEKSHLDGYGADVLFIRFSSERQPVVVDQKMGALTKQSRRFYNGCYAHVSWTCYAFDRKGNKGVAFGLGNVQKYADGEQFGAGSTNPEDDFAPIAGAEPVGGDDDLAQLLS